MERDTVPMHNELCHTNFNPRAPHGARPTPTFEAGAIWQISIHALRMERDYPCFFHWFYSRISIHALRMERDLSVLFLLIGRSYFNPRAPHGARRILIKGVLCVIHFNPRAPHGARPSEYPPTT